MKTSGKQRMATANSAKPPATPTRASVAEHIAVEASNLARIAKANDFSLLAYLIDMAVLEAWREAGEAGHGPAAEDEAVQARGQQS